MKTEHGGFAADYIQVSERLQAFYAKYPDGSIQSEIVELSDSRVVMRAYAYRNAEDPRPGVGYSSLEIPGRTPYTRGSEIENCETSAWGRAIAALGFEVKRGIASAEEVRNKSGADPKHQPEPERQAPRAPRPAASTVPPEPDWMAEQKLGWKERTDWGGPAKTDAVANPSAPLTTKQLLDLATEAKVDIKRLGAIARQLFGDGMLKNLTDDQRAAVWEEATA